MYGVHRHPFPDTWMPSSTVVSPSNVAAAGKPAQVCKSHAQLTTCLLSVTDTGAGCNNMQPT